ncbi:hypothetical protein KTO58_00515 [Chitinophaga pendula]|uniref:S41 family peptidase n=1 Tax=Chitinophaga TaxID=79328 RepID=UPI000BB08384|nr:MULTISPECIES: S41 family peptidase [Chitinophaga]ASZ14656.1 hypothetical protein CK934_28740 [Chitinophaga sp. MD30]UCJ07692.1 hypothetical protein KTO58_00515 [Chitinophaga pendula]
MNKSAFLVLLFFFVPFITYSQDCHCLNNFEYLVRKITENYPGFEDKVNSRTVVQYQYYTDSLRRLAAYATAERCPSVLRSWLGFFKDKHLILRLSGGVGEQAYVRSVFAAAPAMAIDIGAVRRRFAGVGKGGIGLEGIWLSADSAFEVALLRNAERRYQAVVLKADSVFWMPGQIKFEMLSTGHNSYQVMYRNRDHEEEMSGVVAEEESAVLRFAGTEWRKLLAGGNNRRAADPADDAVIAFKILNPLTTYLRLNSFSIVYKSVIDSLIRQHLPDITSRPNLIVDLRNNRGGYSIAFESLLPIIYTGEIRAPRAKVLATRDNTALFEELVADPRIPAKNKEVLGPLLVSMKAHPDTYVITEEEIFQSDTVYSYPARVALLINERSVSAAEDLIMRARQSKKVKVFGRNSAGSFDYFNLVGPRTMPCKHYIYYCPTSKGMWVPEHPIDNIGLPPDIPISEVTDWVSYINTYFQHQKSWRN